MEDYMKIHNYMEDVVDHILPRVIKNDEHFNTCAKCQADIKALALNHLTPHYVSTLEGEVYTKVSEMYVQFEADVLQELIKAMMIVRENPNHE